jgi:predicted Na+-dependent transporter
MALDVRSGAISLEICGGQNGSGTGLSLSTLLFFVSTIPSLLRTNLHCNSFYIIIFNLRTAAFKAAQCDLG